MYRAVHLRWTVGPDLQGALQPGEVLRTRVGVRFDREGRVRAVEVLGSSRLPAFDQTVVAAFTGAAVFGPPPVEILDGKGEVAIGFAFDFTLSPRAKARPPSPAGDAPAVPR